MIVKSDVLQVNKSLSVFKTIAVLTPFMLYGVCHANSLVELQSMAVAKNPKLAASKAGLQVAQAKATQAQSSFFPTVTLSATETHGRSFHTFQNYQKEFEPIKKRYVSVKLNQPLFQASYLGQLEQARFAVSSSKLSQQEAFEEVTVEVVNLFFDTLATHARVELLKKQIHAVLTQKKQARRSFELGTVSITDVRESEAKYDGLVAQKRAAEYELIAKQTALEQLTGTRIVPKRYTATLSKLPPLTQAELKKWQFAMEQQNAQLQQAKREYKASLLEEKTLHDAKLPALDLSVETRRNFGIDTDDDDLQQRRWDLQVGLNLNWQIFDAGGTDAQILAAQATAHQKQQQSQEIQRNVSKELTQVHYSVLSAMSNYTGLMTAVRSNKTSLAANQKGYEVGMRVNADVLDAQSKLFEVQNKRLDAWYESWKGYIKLRQLAGSLQSEDLQYLDTLLLK